MREQYVEEDSRSDNFKTVIRLDVTSKDDFKTNTVRSLYEWWASFQPKLPARMDFDITQHWSMASSLYMVEAIAPGRYLHRLNGETVVDIIGASLRGHEISATNPLPELRRLSQYFDCMVAEKKSRRCCGVVEGYGNKYSEFETVDCPLVDKDGNVNFIIGAISLVD